ncbi:conjugal transfer protein TraB [Kitasatospora sp. NPDC001540]|uniref:conjugal transfer protein TraB n=1 Tax=Kitasatospora sp. NPDC001540 TaxID=3364014 RepID=UPI0036B026FD
MPAAKTAAVYSGRRRRPRPGADDSSGSDYEAVQHTLKVFSEAMQQAVKELEGLDKKCSRTADEASTLAGNLADADVDGQFVAMTQDVAKEQARAAKAVHQMLEQAQQAASAAVAVQRAHARMYGPLHRVRKGRKYRTPKPGFFQ